MSTYREVEGSEDFLAGVSAHRGSGRNCFGDSGGPVLCKLYHRQVIASVNSRISGSIFDMVHYLLGQIPAGEYCAKADVIWGVRMSTHKKLISQLRKTD